MRARLAATPILLFAGLCGLSCGSAAPVPPATRLPPERGETFSRERAWAHLKALTEIGPRVSGTEGAARARAYLIEQLEAAGVEHEQDSFEVTLREGADPLELTNVLATIPGTSDDWFLLVAPYDTQPFEDVHFVGANAGGSGAALLLELARVLQERPLHYTTRIFFLDGEAPRPTGEPDAEPATRLASRSLATGLSADGLFPRVRLAVAFDQIGDADLAIARDLYSDRFYREEFWRAAARLGRTEAFAPAQPFESATASHTAFWEAGLRRVVAIIDTRFGGEEPPGIYANSEDDSLDHCAPESLETVGVVTLDALESVSRRLAKIDRFARSPLGRAQPEQAPATSDGTQQPPEDPNEPPAEVALPVEAPADPTDPPQPEPVAP
jgi:glutaminyl-peptide cyclotransferase